MTMEIRLMKAAPDAASPERLQAARSVAQDPDAPRRILANPPDGRVELPASYLHQIADQAPRQASPEERDSWLAARMEALREAEAWGESVFGGPDIDPYELTWAELLDRYDALAATDQEQWDAAFRTLALEWVDATAAEFGGATDTRWSSGWNECVERFPTVDGGELLVCAVDELDVGEGVPKWFEAVSFLLWEVADAAGFREPSHLEAS